MANKGHYRAVSPQVNFPKLENETLKKWDDEQIFQRSLDQTREGEFYSFYDGPPFATGLPHYGHLLAGLLKDIIPRYWTMRGYHVPRYFGWDCHGVPVEFEVNKQLKVKSSAEVLEFGIDKYNETCRGIVDRYTSEWETTVRRMGRWVDMKNDYRTMDLSFMQSVWWVFQQMWDKGLIYEGYKVVPYSIGISTPLSNFEASQNYKMVQDPAITVRFRVKGEINIFFLAWTTTPWTLPSNLALAVGNDIDYVRVKKGDETYILAKERASLYAKDLEANAEAIDALPTEKGSTLLGKEYEPLFPYFADQVQQKAFRVIASDHVTTDAGTGIVHMAPAFGEEDFFACQKAGLPIVNPVDDDGKFTGEVPDYQGIMVKDADKEIIKRLKAEEKLFKQETLNHSYPHCERTDTPLIYKAVSSWFVKVEAIKDKLVANNQKTSWVPESLRDGRFGNWLENARDWAISRNRFWGTPLPIWRNDEGEVICIGSAKELEEKSGHKVTDLHIHHIDQIEIPSPTGKSPLKRIKGVLDCWFESGSMPMAQWGYPHDNSRSSNFSRGFPADFIAEGLDQTRGWFYTLMVIATALFDKPAFKNVVVNGIILAEDGRKMSKRLKNYPDPMEVLDRHGADALRLYLIDSPVVKAEDLRFSEKGVEEIVRKIMLRWWNAYSFFVNYASIDSFEPKGDFAKTTNVLDKWILSRLNRLTLHVNQEMEAYRLYNVVPALLTFIEELTNTYIRFNRRHFWAEGMPEDKRFAFETLYEVLFQLSHLMAPFTPFIADEIYQNLAQVSKTPRDSVHLASYPKGDSSFSFPELERSVGLMTELCLMGRNLREKVKIKGKIPLKSLTVITRDKAALEELKNLESYFVDELNVRSVRYDSNEDDRVQISAKANFPRLGKRLGKKMKAVAAGIGKFTVDEIVKLEKGDTISVDGEEISIEDVDIRRQAKNPSDSFITARDLSIDVDVSIDEDQLREGLAREIVRRIQTARKNAGLNFDHRIHLELSCDDNLKTAINEFEKYISGETLSTKLILNNKPKGDYEEQFDVDGASLSVALTRDTSI